MTDPALRIGDRPGDVVVDVPPKDDGRRGFQLLRAGDIKLRPPSWLVRDVLERDAVGLLFSDPAVGKSVVTVSLLCAVATGVPWCGRPTTQAPAIYVCGEGHAGVTRRLRAWEIDQGVSLADAPMFISTCAAALCDPLSLVQVEAAIDAVATECGPPGIIAIDTVARNFGAGDENSSRDMGMFVAGVDALRAKYGCTVLLVHHVGHGDKTRARGSIALRGAVDTEYRLDREPDGLIRLTATKMKDAALPEPMAFRLRTVDIGLCDDDGQAVTSVVLDHVDDPAPQPRAPDSGPRGQWQRLALEVLDAIRAEHRARVAADGRDPGMARVAIDDWRAECLSRGMPRQRFHDVRAALVESGVVVIDGGGYVV